MIAPGTPPPTGTPTVDILIPTMDNGTQLYQCVFSLIHGTSDACPATITIINNGQKSYPDRVLGKVEEITVREAGENLGWEGAINLGLKETKSPFVLLLNDDTIILPGNPDWLKRMVDELIKHPECAAIGPASNTVAQKQSIFHPDHPLTNPALGYRLGYTSLLIGFCLLIRRDVFEEMGGLTPGLPGGDDLDLSIKLLAAGWKMLMDRRQFVYHHGSQTGQRIHGQYWNSIEMQDRTKMELIRRHSLRQFITCIKADFEPVRST